MKVVKLGLVITLIYLLAVTPTVSAAPSSLLTKEPSLRVGLGTKQSSVAVSANSAFVIKDKSSNKTLLSLKANTKVLIAAEGKSIKLNDKPIKATMLTVELLNKKNNEVVELNRKSYRGTLEVIYKSGANLTTVNVLPIEEYLYSIVPGEMPSSWHMEAVKAQAVSARSFALNSIRKHESEGFNVCATTHCQVYNGKQAEMNRSTAAVQSTNGLIMLYDNKPIAAVFHSSSGGYTENSEDVWGSYTPYLRSVKDYDEGTPYYQWEKRFTPAKMQEILKSYGYQLGKLQSLELSPLNKDGKNSNDRTLHGRVKTMRFIGDKGSATVSGNNVRTMLGLNSSLFDIGLDIKLGKKNNITAPPNKESIRRINWSNDEAIVINGFGWGHGLGLSQWGAKQMAEKVPETQTTYFKDILNYYYQNCKLQKIY